MNTSDNRQDWIDAYLKGQLNSDEKEDFESKLLIDPDLKSDLEFTKSIQDAAKLNFFKRKVASALSNMETSMDTQNDDEKYELRLEKLSSKNQRVDSKTQQKNGDIYEKNHVPNLTEGKGYRVRSIRIWTAVAVAASLLLLGLTSLFYLNNSKQAIRQVATNKIENLGEVEPTKYSGDQNVSVFSSLPKIRQKVLEYYNSKEYQEALNMLMDSTIFLVDDGFKNYVQGIIAIQLGKPDAAKEYLYISRNSGMIQTRTTLERYIDASIYWLAVLELEDGNIEKGKQLLRELTDNLDKEEEYWIKAQDLTYSLIH